MISQENSSKPSEVPETLLKFWLEKKKIFDSVAVCGTHIGVLQNLMNTGTVSSYPQENFTIPYHHEIAKKYSHLYYALPFLNKIKKVSPNLAREIEGGYTNLPSMFSHLNRRSILQTAKKYSIDQAVKHSFFMSTQQHVSLEVIYQLAIDLLPNEFGDFSIISKTTQHSTNSEFIKPTPEKIGYIYTLFSHEELVNALRTAFKTQLVLLYFNKNIFNNHTIKPGVETADEILIMGNIQLDYKTIAGVEIIPVEKT